MKEQLKKFVSIKFVAMLIGVGVGYLMNSTELILFSIGAVVGIKGAQNITGIIQNGKVAEREAVNTTTLKEALMPILGDLVKPEASSNAINDTTMEHADNDVMPKFEFLERRFPEKPSDYNSADLGEMEYNSGNNTLGGDVPVIMYEDLDKVWLDISEDEDNDYAQIVQDFTNRLENKNYYKGFPEDRRIGDSIRVMEFLIKKLRIIYRTLLGVFAPESLDEMVNPRSALQDYKKAYQEAHNRQCVGGEAAIAKFWIRALFEAYEKLAYLDDLSDETIDWSKVWHKHNNPIDLAEHGLDYTI